MNYRYKAVKDKAVQPEKDCPTVTITYHLTPKQPYPHHFCAIDAAGETRRQSQQVLIFALCGAVPKLSSSLL
jgi:hypothetical protein